MAKHKLRASQIGKAKKPGMQSDGAGLYLRTSANLTQSWVYRYRKHGKLRDIGLGSTEDTSLAEARRHAEKARKAVKAGKDPRTALRGNPELPTFNEAAKAYIAAHSPGWRNEKHKQQWQNTLDSYAGPHFGELPVDAVDLDRVLAALLPIWHPKPETATRVRARIEAVLNWATVKGYREGFNPAVWRGNLDALLPARNKVQQVKHLAAIPYKELPALYAEFCKSDALSALALRFTILTAGRSGEVRGATWGEIHEDLWVIPGKRMKAGREHRVPLSMAARDLLENIDRAAEHIFPGVRNAPMISDMSMTKFMRARRKGITVHGFRSAFRDWAAEETLYQNHIAEMALAHSVGNAVEAAYRRGDLLEKRRALMEDWASFVTGTNTATNVIPGEFGKQAAK